DTESVGTPVRSVLAARSCQPTHSVDIAYCLPPVQQLSIRCPSQRQAGMNSDRTDSKSYEVGMQIARRVYSQGSAQGVGRAVAAILGGSVSGMGAPKRESDRRRALASRSRA